MSVSRPGLESLRSLRKILSNRSGILIGAVVRIVMRRVAKKRAIMQVIKRVKKRVSVIKVMKANRRKPKYQSVRVSSIMNRYSTQIFMRNYSSINLIIAVLHKLIQVLVP